MTTDRLAALLAALTDEDEIAHGEAIHPDTGRGLGACAYCDERWPCRTQRGIDRALAAAGVTLAQPAGLDVEAYREGLAHAKATYGPGHRAAAIAEVRQAVAALRIEPDDYRAAWQHNMTLDEVQAELDRLDNLPAAAIAREYGAPQPASIDSSRHPLDAAIACEAYRDGVTCLTVACKPCRDYWQDLMARAARAQPAPDALSPCDLDCHDGCTSDECEVTRVCPRTPAPALDVDHLARAVWAAMREDAWQAMSPLGALQPNMVAAGIARAYEEAGS